MFTLKKPAFELAPVLAAWTDAPRFLGNSKKDPPVEMWLAQIEAGCLARRVPKAMWLEVAQNFMGVKAKKRLQEVERVMRCMHGESWVLQWKTFVVAMKNMGWTTDPKKTRVVEIQRKLSGGWWILGGSGKDSDNADNVTKKSTDRDSAPGKVSEVKNKLVKSPPPTPAKAAKVQTPDPKRSQPTPVQPVPSNQGKSTLSRAVSSLTSSVSLRRDPPPPPPPATIMANVPLWLLAASEALDSVISVHPRAASVLAAVLITVGTLPAAVPVGGAASILAEAALGLGMALRAKSGSEAGA